MPPNPNILIDTPSYAGMVHIDYLSAISDYLRGERKFTVSAIGNESLITRPRSTILSKFHTDHRYTHLFFQDGDVIGAAVPLNGYNDQGERIFNVGACLGKLGS